MLESRINILKQLPHYIVVNKPPLCFSQPPDTSDAGRIQLQRQGAIANDTVLAQLEHSYPLLFDANKNPQLSKPPFCTPKLVHRLDHPVSGAMVLATSTSAAAKFAKNLKLGGEKGWPLQKYYAALVLGAPDRNAQNFVTWMPSIKLTEEDVKGKNAIEDVTEKDGKQETLQNENAIIGKSKIPKKQLEIFTGTISKPIDGKPAYTQFWIPPQPQTLGLAPYSLASKFTLDEPVMLAPYTLVLFSPLTGRKHQIRKHAAEVLRSPILGDELYIDDRVRMLEYMKSGKYEKDLETYGKTYRSQTKQKQGFHDKGRNKNKTGSFKRIDRDPEFGIVRSGKDGLASETIDLMMRYPVNGIALHSYMVNVKSGLNETQVRAPFWRNSEAWNSFVTSEGYLPEYLYEKCVADKPRFD